MARLSNLFSLSKCIEIVQAYAPYYLQGIVYTVLLSILAIIVGFVFALLLTLMRRSRIAPLRYISIAASVCPLSTAWIPARMISETYAAELHATETAPGMNMAVSIKPNSVTEGTGNSRAEYALYYSAAGGPQHSSGARQ